MVNSMNEPSKNSSVRLTVVGMMIVAAAAVRLATLPYPNVQPITAMALFGGACLSRRWLAFAVPLGAMLATDLIIGFHSTMWAVYGCFALFVVFGQWLRTRRKPLVIAGVAATSSFVFFLVTNFAAWLGSGFYPQNFLGLMEAYTAGLAFYNVEGTQMSFFLNQFCGDMIFATLLFGGLACVEKMWPGLRESPEAVPAI
jgi:hypothetical protein